MSKIIVVTECPRFSDAGSHQRCDLVSDDKTWSFYIPWHFSQMAMPRCEKVLDAHREEARNVKAFRTKVASPDHG